MLHKRNQRILKGRQLPIAYQKAIIVLCINSNILKVHTICVIRVRMDYHVNI